MAPERMLAGDAKLMRVDESASPFARVQSVLAGAEVVFANLECCFFTPVYERSVQAVHRATKTQPKTPTFPRNPASGGRIDSGAPGVVQPMT